MFSSIALSTVLSLSLAAAAPDPGRVGLFVGIDAYPKIEGGDLRGCVRDVRMLERLFATRFGFALCFVNDTRWRLYVHVLALDSGVVGAAPRPVEPHGTLELAHFEALASAPLERTTLELIAAGRPLDLHAVLAPPRAGSPARAESGPHDIGTLLGELVQGGPRTRAGLGGLVEAGPAYWTTATAVFDVEER